MRGQDAPLSYSFTNWECFGGRSIPSDYVTDDIMLYGVGCTDDELLANHDTKLQARLQRCRDVEIGLNKSKIKLLQKSLIFFRHLITDKGLTPMPENVNAIDEYRHLLIRKACCDSTDS